MGLVWPCHLPCRPCLWARHYSPLQNGRAIDILACRGNVLPRAAVSVVAMHPCHQHFQRHVCILNLPGRTRLVGRRRIRELVSATTTATRARCPRPSPSVMDPPGSRHWKLPRTRRRRACVLPRGLRRGPLWAGARPPSSRWLPKVAPSLASAAAFA